MRPLPLIAAVVLLAFIAGALWLHAWGALALVLVGAAGIGWYRIQVARGAAEAEQFFGDAGEETRLTGLGGASPSEMPTPEALRDRDSPH